MCTRVHKHHRFDKRGWKPSNDDCGWLFSISWKNTKGGTSSGVFRLDHSECLLARSGIYFLFAVCLGCTKVWLVKCGKGCRELEGSFADVSLTFLEVLYKSIPEAEFPVSIFFWFSNEFSKIFFISKKYRTIKHSKSWRNILRYKEIRQFLTSGTTELAKMTIDPL